MKSDIQGFLDVSQFPNKRKIHNHPPIYIIDNFLSKDECNYIISLSKNQVQKSLVVDAVSGLGVPHPSRTSSSCYHGYDLKWLVSRVHRLTGVPQECQEPTQVARYHTGQFYLSHLDALSADKLKDGNQRIGTVLIYLNNVQKGGATFFNNINVRVQPKEGSAVVFFPSKMDGTILESMLHTAEDASDTKWVSQIWLRNKKYTS